MLIQITLQDLMVFLVCALGIIAGILLIPILWNVKKIVGVFKPLVEANKEAIKKSFKTIPVIVEDVGQISSNVKELTNELKASAPAIIKDVQCAAGSAKESFESAGAVVENIETEINDTITSFKKDNSEKGSGLLAFFPIIGDALRLILRAFSSGK
jgi:vacuolar-type H+-ATPase subunit I/STV1